MFIGSVSFAQDSETTAENQKSTKQTKETASVAELIYNTNDLIKKPEYPGGIQDFYKFIGANYKMPKTPPNVFLKGKIHLTFIVEKDGSLTDIKIVNDIGYGTGEEAARVVKLSKKWIPGKTSEGTVAVLYSLPITIQSEN